MRAVSDRRGDKAERDWRVTIFLMDAGLRGSEGHHDHFARGFARALGETGRAFRVLAHLDVDATVMKATSAEPVFSVSPYDHVDADPFVGPDSRFHAEADSMVRDLQAFGLQVDRTDLVFLPTATPGQLAGLGRHLLARGQRPRVAAIFHWGSQWQLMPGTLAGALMRRAAHETAGLERWLAATHDELAAALSRVFDEKVRIAPSLTFHAPIRERGLVSEPGLRVGIVGGLRASKGAKAIPKIVDGVRERGLDVCFAIQVHSAGPLPDEIRRLKGADVRLITDWVDEAELLDLLAAVDVVLLPYDSVVYSTMVSGTFTLAAGQALPCIAPAETWMGAQLMQGVAAGLTYDGTVAGAIGAIDEACRRKLDLSKSARTLSAFWRSARSAERVVEDVLAFPGN